MKFILQNSMISENNNKYLLDNKKVLRINKKHYSLFLVVIVLNSYKNARFTTFSYVIYYLIAYIFALYQLPIEQSTLTCQLNSIFPLQFTPKFIGWISFLFMYRNWHYRHKLNVQWHLNTNALSVYRYFLPFWAVNVRELQSLKTICL